MTRVVKNSLPRLHAAAFVMALVVAGLSSSADAQQGGRQRQGRPEGAAAPASSPVPPAQAPRGEANSPAPAAAPLPPDKTTEHTVRAGDREIAFNATAGTIPLFDERSGAVSARIGYIAFTLKDGDAKTRPVTFVWNGGPGYASAWLNLGAIGPWRLDMDGAAARPSAAPVTQDNAETWLAFTDLVFIDPAGTGFGRIPGGDEPRKFFWSVNGDIASIASAVRRWLTNNGRTGSPKFLTGESYGGFRAPKIAHRLQTDEGIGVNGMILISPVLDFGRFRSGGVLSHVARLPSYAATALEKKSPITRASLIEIEPYAQGEFLSDLMKGLKDQAALTRLTDNVTRLTGLDRALVARLAGRIPSSVFAREIHAREGKVASGYDGNATGLDPNPFSQVNEADDQLLRGLHAPIVSTMLDIYQNRLQWTVPNGRYMFQNAAAGRQWDWGNRNQEATSDLATAMALDSSMRVLITHGLTDLVTPYLETKMVLDQMPGIGDAGRLKFQVYPGGHMYYAREASRKAFRDDARALIEGK